MCAWPPGVPCSGSLSNVRLVGLFWPPFDAGFMYDDDDITHTHTHTKSRAMPVAHAAITLAATLLHLAAAHRCFTSRPPGRRALEPLRHPRPTCRCCQCCNSWLDMYSLHHAP